LPFTLIGADELKEQTHIHAPAAAEINLINYINALFEVNSLQPMSELLVRQDNIYVYHGYDAPTTFRTTCKNTKLEVSVVLCDHSIPTISYCFSEVKSKLKAEFRDTDGRDIAMLRKSGVAVTEEVVQPALAYICDTSIQVLARYPEVLTYPVIFIECTFLYPEELENAASTKHIHWQDLRRYIETHQETLFVLIHFSLRYKDAEILAFFEMEQEKNDGIGNIKIWAGDTSI
jgi:ribonuclease Z